MVSSSLLAPILVFVLDQTHIHTNDYLSLSLQVQVFSQVM